MKMFATGLHTLLLISITLSNVDAASRARLQRFERTNHLLRQLNNENTIDIIGKKPRSDKTLHDRVLLAKMMRSFSTKVMESKNIDSCDNFSFQSYLDPYWFHYYYDYDKYTGMKDWSSYYDCNEFVCDYTALTEAFQGACYDFDGALYSVNVNITCPDRKHIDNGLPMCVSSSCNLDDSYFQEYFKGWCGEETLIETQLTKVPSPISEECTNQKLSFTEDAGSGDPNFIYQAIEYEERVEKYCKIKNEVEICNYLPIVNQLKSSCEDEGGTMYRFSDKASFSEGYYGDGPIEFRSLNVPLCIGTTCSPKAYFEDIIVPSQQFYYQGDFLDVDGTLEWSSNYTLSFYSPAGTENPYAKFLLKVEVVDGEKVEKVHTCKWLIKRPPKAKKRICASKKHQVFSDTFGPASNVCVDTCDPYCREEKANAKFLYQINGNNSTVQPKQCKWLKAQEADDIVQICNSTVLVKNSIYSQAAETCTETCGTC